MRWFAYIALVAIAAAAAAQENSHESVGVPDEGEASTVITKSLGGRRHRASRNDSRTLRLAVLSVRTAAEQGNADAQFKLGDMYATGEGVPKDDREAERWFRMAAEQGHLGAQMSLVKIYTGEWCPNPENAREAARWFRDSMTRAQIAEAQRLSRELAD